MPGSELYSCKSIDGLLIIWQEKINAEFFLDVNLIRVHVRLAAVPTGHALSGFRLNFSQLAVHESEL